MKIPADVPTDSLYKFMAIGGMVVFVVSGYLRVQVSRDELRSWTDLVAQIAAHNSRWEFLDLGNETTVPGSGTPADSSEATSPQRASNQLQLLDEEHEVIGLELRYLESLQEQNRIIGLALTLSAVLGAGVATLGFWWWYVRVQRPIDHRVLGGSPETHTP